MTMMVLVLVATMTMIRSGEAFVFSPSHSTLSKFGRSSSSSRGVGIDRSPLQFPGRSNGQSRGQSWSQSWSQSRRKIQRNMVLTTPDAIIEQVSTQKLLDDLIDESVRTSARKPIMMQFKPGGTWIWLRWKGTVFSESWDTCLRNMAIAAVVAAAYHVYPSLRTNKLVGFNILWGQLLSVTTFTLTFFLNVSYNLWRKCYELSRRLQGRLNDLGLTMAAHADRTSPTEPNEPSTYTPAARQLLELMSRYVRVFNLLCYASFTVSHRPILTPAGMRRLADRGLLTPRERQILVDADVPATQRHNNLLLWIARIFVEGRRAGHIVGGSGLEQTFLDKIHVIRSQYGAIGDELQGRMPLAYAHIVQVLVDVVLIMYPFMAFSSPYNMAPWLGILGTGLLTIFYQGLFDLAKQFLDPYDNENYGNGDDPLCVDTLVAETNAGSMRWLNGIAEIPFRKEHLVEGKLQEYLLPLKGISVEQLLEQEMEKELLEKQKRKEEQEQERLEQERLEKERLELEQELLQRQEKEMMNMNMNTNTNTLPSQLTQTNANANANANGHYVESNSSIADTQKDNETQSELSSSSSVIHSVKPLEPSMDTVPSVTSITSVNVNSTKRMGKSVNGEAVNGESLLTQHDNKESLSDNSKNNNSNYYNNSRDSEYGEMSPPAVPIVVPIEDIPLVKEPSLLVADTEGRDLSANRETLLPLELQPQSQQPQPVITSENTVASVDSTVGSATPSLYGGDNVTNNAVPIPPSSPQPLEEQMQQLAEQIKVLQRQLEQQQKQQDVLLNTNIGGQYQYDPSTEAGVGMFVPPPPSIPPPTVKFNAAGKYFSSMEKDKPSLFLGGGGGGQKDDNTTTQEEIEETLSILNAAPGASSLGEDDYEPQNDPTMMDPNEYNRIALEEKMEEERLETEAILSAAPGASTLGDDFDHQLDEIQEDVEGGAGSAGVGIGVGTAGAGTGTGAGSMNSAGAEMDALEYETERELLETEAILKAAPGASTLGDEYEEQTEAAAAAAKEKLDVLDMDGLDEYDDAPTPVHVPVRSGDDALSEAPSLPIQDDDDYDDNHNEAVAVTETGTNGDSNNNNNNNGRKYVIVGIDDNDNGKQLNTNATITMDNTAVATALGTNFVVDAVKILNTTLTTKAEATTTTTTTKTANEVTGIDD